MMAIAMGGLAVNVTGLWILSAERNESLNLRGAWLHLATDAMGSVGAISGGLLIWTLGWNWAMATLPGVTAVHDLHVWSITSGIVALSGHVCVADGVHGSGVLQELCTRVREDFGIDHITIQVEPDGFSELAIHA